MMHPRWTHADPRANALYIHLHDPENSVLRLAGRAELVESGPDLVPGDRMRPIDFDPAVSPSEAVLLLRNLLVDQLPLHPNDRWMAVSWLLTAFFLDRSHRRALLRVTGRIFDGRATALKLLTTLLYGHRELEVANVDLLAESASRNPLLAFEQSAVEFEDEPEVSRLLVSLARGAGVKTLAAMVEDRPFEPPEFVRWSFRISCARKYFLQDFDEQQSFEELSQARSRILSGLFQLFANQVVPGQEERRIAVMERLVKGFPGHRKCHLDTFLALMTVVLRALMLELYDDARRAEFEAWTLVESWIESQA